MISIVAHGIMGTAYRQDVVVNEGVRNDGSLTSLHDIRHLLSIQYGDETPMTGWAFQPATTGMWLSHIERAFDTNYMPAYIMVSFLIPFGINLRTEALQTIEHSLIDNHNKYMQQSVILFDADWSFLKKTSQQLENFLEYYVPETIIIHQDKHSDAYWSGDISTMLANMWNPILMEYGIVFCGNRILARGKMFVSIDDTQIQEKNISEPKQRQSDDIVREQVPPILGNSQNKKLHTDEQPSCTAMLDKGNVDDIAGVIDGLYSFKEKERKKRLSDESHKTNRPSNKINKLPKNYSTVGQLFSFNGRIGRRDYALTVYCFFLLFLIIFCASCFYLVSVLLYIPFLWVLYAQGTKRCHDLGHNGWWQFIPFYVLWMIFQDGVYSSLYNEYGPTLKHQLSFQEQKRHQNELVKNSCLILVAMFAALAIPLTTGVVNQQVADITHQRYLSDITRVVITMAITTISYGIAYIFIYFTIFKKSFLFNIVSLILTFIWSILWGLIFLPD